jgi:hypothetical protein
VVRHADRGHQTKMCHRNDVLRRVLRRVQSRYAAADAESDSFTFTDTNFKAVAVGSAAGPLDVGVDQSVQASGVEAGTVTGVDGAGIQFAESCHGHEVVVDV